MIKRLSLDKGRGSTFFTKKRESTKTFFYKSHIRTKNFRDEGQFLPKGVCLNYKSLFKHLSENDFIILQNPKQSHSVTSNPLAKTDLRSDSSDKSAKLN